MVVIDPNWILLDTCSTDSVFCDERFLSKIVKCDDDEVLQIISNVGMVTYEEKGVFNLLDIPVNHNADSIANVLSFTQVASLPGIYITTDTAVERAMVVHVNGRSLKFSECDQGLYYLDLSEYKLNDSINKYSISSSFRNVNLLQSINEN